MASSTADQQLCRRFSLAEIQSATGDFSDAQVIGKGGFGKVYKGLIDNGSLTVAIKRLAANSKQGEREFAAEMETLTKFRHRNLVSLIGYCSEEEEMILVYEYMANGTLADHLYGSNGSSLSWNKRLRICIGAGRGLDYLHYGCSIIHRDVKSTNILLDHNFTAKVSDFGLAKLDVLQSHVSTNVKGSFGYFDPSYFTTGRLTMASDTYAFGVILLEMLTGKSPIGRNLAVDELCMTMWAQEKIRNGKADQIVDPNLKGEVSEGCLKTFVGVVKRCLLNEPKKRLTMTLAVVQLELALQQQEKKGITTAPRILQFWNRVIPSAGSTENDENEVEVDELPIAAPAIEEDRPDHIVDTFPIYVPAIPLADIRKITDGFSSKCMIFHRFGARNVFHGVLESGQDALIVRLYNVLPNFIAQVSKISRLEHENMVKLVGYCLDGYEQVLVHEFAPRPRGTLHDILHGRQGIEGLHMEPCRALSWAQRIKIAVGIAEGLCYIHDNDLIHDNIASNNILLFNDDIAKIHNLYPSTQCSCIDYYDLEYHPYKFRQCNHPPEYAQSGGQADKKTDVYSFGVVLLELLTGAEVFDRTRGLWEHNIVSWAQPKLRSVKLHEIIDVGFKADYPPKEVERMAKVAASCLRDVLIRPDMSVVLRELKAIEDKEEDGIENKPIAAPAALQADHIVNMLPIYVPTFPLADIKDITHNFSDKCIIRYGFGGGNVFHGILKSGQDVAIKKLDKELPDHEFIAQVSRVSSLKHENVVELVGYCWDGDLRVLVYEFAPRGSLHDILHGQQDLKGLDTEPCPALSWAQRLKIAVGIAAGLCYIHGKDLIHHNIKSNNILLFNDDSAKLTNLGPPTQRSCPCNVPNCDEHPLSRSNYHPPEYNVTTGRYELSDQTQKEDVYRFGVVLLELLTGSKLVDSRRGVGQQNIVSWAQPQLGSDKVHKIVDARLKEDYPPKAVHKMALVAALCIQYEAKHRPNMSVVLRALRRILPKPQ